MAFVRPSFQEVMSLLPLSSSGTNDDKEIKRYMSARAAWLPASDLKVSEGVPQAIRATFVNKNAFGAHVYCQSGIAAAKALRESPWVRNEDVGNFSIHTMHGHWPGMGWTDRPFIYEVTPLAISSSFLNILVTARQPRVASVNGDRYTAQDADTPLGQICFSGLLSFRKAEPTLYGHQEPSVQDRFASILASRPPEDWIPAPPVDIDLITDAVPRDFVGNFPAIEMRKVDMRDFNTGKPLQEQRELILYRLLEPLPADNPSAHVMAHVYESDRNGLLMFLNHLGMGRDYGHVASLSHSIVVHTNPEGVVMKGDGWWVQEALFSKSDAARGLLHSKIWSPAGVHVATCYQDGLMRQRQVRLGTGLAEKL